MRLKVTGESFWRLLNRVVWEGRAGNIEGCSVHYEPATGMGRISVEFVANIPPEFLAAGGEEEEEEVTVSLRAKTEDESQ